MMKKVMIVDDEVLVRIGIKSILEWEKYGYQVVAEAADGKEALQLIEEHHPNIVLTDLVMAPMDGFELIQHCRKKYPSVKFIVLSSYNDMDNVKKAMKLGAVDYVFKLKVTPEGLLEMLNEVETEEVQENAGPPAKWKNIPEIRQRLLGRILENTYARLEEAEQERKRLDLKVSLMEPVFVLQVSIDDFKLNLPGNTIRETNLLEFSMINISEELLGKCLICDIYQYKNGMVILIRADREEKEIQDSVKSCFFQMGEYVRRYLGITISGCLSSRCENAAQIRQAVKVTQTGIERRIYKGLGYYCTCSQLGGTKKKLKIPYEGLVQDVGRQITKDGEKLKNYVNRFFRQLGQLENVNEAEVRKYYMELYHGIIKNAEYYQVDAKKLRDKDEDSLYDVVVNGDTSTRIKEGFDTIVERFIAAINDEKAPAPREDIMKAKQYIRNNLASELTVTSVSEMLGINGSYFSHIFKKETGYNFVDYVNQARIEKAKDLLLTTDYKIYEIAQMVGIDSPNYFSILFKKITGQSPNDVRKR